MCEIYKFLIFVLIHLKTRVISLKIITGDQHTNNNNKIK